MDNKNIIGLLVAVAAIAGAIIYLGEGKARPGISAVPVIELGTDAAREEGGVFVAKDAAERIAAKEARYGRAKEIVAPAGFVNTNGQPIRLADYVGEKVILLDIMTYSCINCIRTFPYVTGWYEKYRDDGLVIIGIHTPEFEFEKDKANVEAAMRKYGIGFPVVLDNDYGTWTAYRNLYWPRKYLVDIDGFIRYDHIGEGAYEETERQIRELLIERAAVLGIEAGLDGEVTKEPAPQARAGQSPETYFGSARNGYFANGERGRAGIQDLDLPEGLLRNRLYLGGKWRIEPEHAENLEPGAEIVYPFSAKSVFLVMSAESPVDVEVLIDGEPVGPLRGKDVTSAGGKDVVTVSESRLYTIYEGDSFGSHTLTLRPLSPGLKAFAFTFGS